MAKAATAKPVQRGIAYWIERVVAEREKARESFDAESVHDLRVALRRCRSVAEGLQCVDGDPSWKKMRRAGKIIFAALGELRDTQVLLEWVERLSSDCPPVAERLKNHCLRRELELKESAAGAVNGFDVERWLRWAPKLDGRVVRIGNLPEVFQVLALERYEAAHELHATALRNRSKTSLHQLRIGFKKLRYMIENFLPEQDKSWSGDLKYIQDVLGEVHDLDVLWDTARQIHAFASLQERQLWYAAVSRERNQRVQAYRDKMVGRHSLWQGWRSGLPEGEQLHRAVLKRFEAWAASMDSNPAHTHMVTHFSLELFDALQAGRLVPEHSGAVSPRDLLQVAALTLGAGRQAGSSAPHKVSGRLLQDSKVPPGWSVNDLLLSALIARYHRGSLPSTQKLYAALSVGDQHLVDCLGGILRLADSLGSQDEQVIRGIMVNDCDGHMDIIADGYNPRTKHAEQIAAARHLLEHAFGTAFLVRESSEPRLGPEQKPDC